MNDGTENLRPASPRRKRERKRIFVLSACASGVLGVLGAAAYCFAYANEYDPEIMHYKTGSATIIAAGVFFACSVIAAIVCAAALKKASGKLFGMSGTGALFFTLFSGLMFAAYAVSTLISSRGLPSGAFETCAFFAAIVSAVSLVARMVMRRSRLLRITLSFFPAIFFILLIFVYYFDLTTAPINSPEKGLTNVVLSAAVLFFISDSREMLGRPGRVFPVFARVCASFIVTPTAAARILLRFTSGFASPPFIVNVLLFSVGLYALFQLASTWKRTDRALEFEPDPDADDKTERKDKTEHTEQQ